MTPVDLASIVVAAAIVVVVAVRVARALASVAIPLGVAVLAALYVLNRVDGGPVLARHAETALPFLGDLYARIAALIRAP